MFCVALGTNDLGYGESADILLPVLLGMHDRARATGARTVVLSIPQFALELVREGGRGGGRGGRKGREEGEGGRGGKGRKGREEGEERGGKGGRKGRKEVRREEGSGWVSSSYS